MDGAIEEDVVQAVAITDGYGLIAPKCRLVELLEWLSGRATKI